MHPKIRLDIRMKMDHITQGKRASCWSCPLALAVIEAVANEDSDLRNHPVIVGGEFVTIGRYGAPLTDKMRKFMRDFDSGALVEPFIDEIVLRWRLLENIRFF